MIRDASHSLIISRCHSGYIKMVECVTAIATRAPTVTAPAWTPMMKMSFEFLVLLAFFLPRFVENGV